jgi:hypothetical protein
MAEIQAPVQIETDMLHLQFQVDGGGVPIGTLGSILGKLSYMLTDLGGHKPVRGGSDAHQQLLREFFGSGPEQDSWPEFYAVRIGYGSPLDIWLVALGVPRRIVRAVVTFLQFVTYHEETRQRLAALAAFEFEKAEAERLKNVQTVLRIAKDLDKVGEEDPEKVRRLMEFSRYLENPRVMKLTTVAFVERQDRPK